MTLKYYGFSVTVIALLSGCGGSIAGGIGNTSDDGGLEASSAPDVITTNPGPDTSTVDTGGMVTKADTGAGETSGLNHGTVSATYPAFTPFMPPVLNGNGGVLANPQFYTVTWPSLDSNSATWEAFDDGIGTSSYWAATTAEYGVGAGSAGTHIELTTEASFSSMTDIENFVAANAGAAWAPSTLNANVLYVLYLPPGQSINVEGFGDACSSGVEGYHDLTTANADGSTVVFGVVFDCEGERPNDVTSSASHELVEASTDPYNNTAWVGVDDTKYLAWDAFQQLQDELADMCEFYPDDDYTDPTLGVSVQRIWSNMSATAGSAPCVPAAAGAYFNVTPLTQGPINIDASSIGGPASFATVGYYIPIGSSKTFPVGFYSDSANPAWNIVVHAGNPLSGQTANVDATVDVASGANGNMSYVTVKVNGQDSSGTNSNLITIESQVPGDQMFDFGGGVRIGAHSRWMPILISSQM